MVAKVRRKKPSGRIRGIRGGVGAITTPGNVKTTRPRRKPPSRRRTARTFTRGVRGARGRTPPTDRTRRLAKGFPPNPVKGPGAPPNFRTGPIVDPGHTPRLPTKPRRRKRPSSGVGDKNPRVAAANKRRLARIRANKLKKRDISPAEQKRRRESQRPVLLRQRKAKR